MILDDDLFGLLLISTAVILSAALIDHSGILNGVFTYPNPQSQGPLYAFQNLLGGLAVLGGGLAFFAASCRGRRCEAS